MAATACSSQPVSFSTQAHGALTENSALVVVTLSMKTITPEQVELIDAVLAEGDVGLLTASILEKDVHVTDALQALMGMQFPGIRLVFCGGTSLSKAYRLIERMSEDVDLKIVLDEPNALTASAQKRHLSHLKTEVCQVLAGLGFEETVEERVARNEPIIRQSLAICPAISSRRQFATLFKS
jgi:hypothetical protein